MQLDMLQKEALKKGLRPSSPEKTSAEASMDEPHPSDSGHEEKAPGAFKTISEAATFLGVPQHVLRFWESRFSQIRPLKLRGGRRYYRPQDMEILTTIKNLLYKQGYTIKGAKKAFGARSLPVLEPEVQQAMKTAPEKRIFTDKQQSQLAVIRQELMGLRETLKPYL